MEPDEESPHLALECCRRWGRQMQVNCGNEDCSVETNLKRCSRCRLVAYCSTDCQRKHFKNGHKNFCIEVSKVPGFTTEKYQIRASTLYTEKQHQFGIEHLVDPGTKKKLECVGSMPRCIKCGLLDGSLEKRTQLFSCPTCRCVHFCNEHKNSDHDCERFQLIFFMQIWDERISKDYEHKNHGFHGCPETQTIIHNEFPKSWEEYFALRFVPELLPHVNSPPITIIHNALCLPCTVLNILYKLQTIPGESFCVHFVGASYREIEYSKVFEEFLHFCPQIQNMRALFIGPAGTKMEGGDIENCDDCKQKNRRRISRFENCLYQDLELEGVEWKPDIIIASNCGIHDTPDIWIPGIEKMLDTNVPVIFTGYTEEESLMDMKIVKNHGSIVIDNQVNPFRGRIPFADPQVWSKIYFEDSFYYVAIKNETCI